MTTLEFVAFDIETTGLAVSDEVTVIGFALPMGCRVVVNTGGRAAPELKTTVGERVDEHVKLTTHNSERAVLEAVGGFAEKRLRDADVLLVAYNGGLWNGGFDLPFLRTRHAVRDVAWPFRELPYTDLLPVMKNRFNTFVADGDSNSDGDDAREEADAGAETGVSRTDLDTVYELLIGGDLGELDPFEDSQEAVTAFEDGAFADIALHNIADVRRTQALGTLAQRYCSKSEFRLKSLTPTVDE